MFESKLNDAIVCIGCSFTHGITVNKAWDNWPFYLYQRLKGKTRVVNMALGGCSLMHSAYQLEYIQKKGIKPKFIFFQVTNPYRITFRRSPITEKDFELQQIGEDFYMTGVDHVVCNSVGNLKRNWLKHYYVERDPEYDVLWTTEHSALLHYITDMLQDYKHFMYSQEEYSEYRPWVKRWLKDDLMPAQYYNDNIVDIGDHLSSQALSVQAKYLAKFL